MTPSTIMSFGADVGRFSRSDKQRRMEEMIERLHEAARADLPTREFYGRRDESFALWIVPREAVLEVREPYVAPVFDRDYRRVDGYSIKVKLKEARELAGTGKS